MKFVKYIIVMCLAKAVCYGDAWEDYCKARRRVANLDLTSEVLCQEAGACQITNRVTFFMQIQLLSLDLAKGMAIVGQAIFAHPVRQPIGTALGAGHDTGSLQLPVGAAPLIAPGLGHFSLRNRHGDTSFGYFGPFWSVDKTY